MNSNEALFVDRPPYDVVLARAVSFAAFFVLSPVFILMAYTEPSYTGWLILLWLFIPLFIIAIAYLLIIPGQITVTRKNVTSKHGAWSVKIPLAHIQDLEVLRYAPWWVNFQHFYPNAQWVHVTKSRGLLKWWYIPATSATQLVVAIRKAMKDNQEEKQ